jgi:hypothetical protein
MPIAKEECLRSEDVVFQYNNNWYCIPFTILAQMPAVISQYAVSQLNLFDKPLPQSTKRDSINNVHVAGIPFAIWKQHITSQLQSHWRKLHHSAVADVKAIVSRNPTQFKSVLISCKLP